ncbi:flagellar basal-body MS-ring/collar protein FliF [Virgibacillus soli]|uniref:flagellar basal-body MS-ring/collar protein FliF n=1 Tax=Paracerasibacillus soli TaxID=480284 RepID=UPI0035E6FC05
MNEKVNTVINKTKSFWVQRTKMQKSIFLVVLIAIIMLISVVSFFSSNPKLVPLYNHLSMQEASQVKAALDEKGIPYELQQGGSTITVPKDQVDSLLVDFAGQGIPDSGNIDYSFFSKNSSWGVTDNEFNIMKLDATQTELANLIKSIDGIENAKVMINMPKDPVFVNESSEPATASIVLHTKPGYQFQDNQINALYTLVSKAVPNLPAENIAIMNQYFEYFDQTTNDNTNVAGANYSNQQAIKRDVEKDIQKRVQQMLGTIVGMDHVIVSVTADVDFTQENRVEEIVEPYDKENMEGLPASIEKIQETYAGKPQETGGTAGVGEGDIPNYPATGEDGDGDYDYVKETINNEYNRIRKEIVESPYKIRDLGIQVAVDQVKDRNEKDVQLLSQQEQTVVQEGISSILNSIVTTSIDKEYGEITPEDKISIVFQKFNEKPMSTDTTRSTIPVWIYIAGGILLLILIALVILLFRKHKTVTDETFYDEEVQPVETQPTIEELQTEQATDTVVRKKQLEKMAQEKPEEFAKLLRSWIGEE